MRIKIPRSKSLRMALVCVFSMALVLVSLWENPGASANNRVSSTNLASGNKSDADVSRDTVGSIRQLFPLSSTPFTHQTDPVSNTKTGLNVTTAEVATFQVSVTDFVAGVYSPTDFSGNSDYVLLVNGSTGARTILTGGNSVGVGVGLGDPRLVTVTNQGQVYYFDAESATLRLKAVAANGDRSLVPAGTGPTLVNTGVKGIAFDQSTNTILLSQIHPSDNTGNQDFVVRVNLTTGNRTTVASNSVGSGVALGFPTALAVSPAGVIYYFDSGAKVVKAIATNGTRTQLPAGTGPALNNVQDAAIGSHLSMSYDASNNTLVVPIVHPTDSTGSQDYVLRIDPVTGNRTVITGNAVGTGAALGIPSATTVTSSGQVYYFDKPNVLMKSVAANGNRTNLTGSGPTLSGLGLMATRPAVALISTTTSITNVAPEPSVVGQSVTVSYSVSAASGTPTGTVTISDGAAGHTCTATTFPTGSCNITNFNTQGVFNLTATYGGDSSFSGSSSSPATAHTVNKAGTTLTITNAASLSGTPTNAGQAYAVNWSVAVNSPGALGAALSGNVNVSDGTDSCMVLVSAGTCNLTSTTTGLKTITVTYAGDTNYNIDSDTTTHQVNSVSGTNSNAPVDFDGDGKTDYAVVQGTFPRANGEKEIILSSDLLADQRQRAWARAYNKQAYLRSGRGFVELPKEVQESIARWKQEEGANPDAKPTTDSAVDLTWHIRLSGNGTTLDVALGSQADEFVPADYDGDGKCDVAVWNGTQFRVKTSSSSFATEVDYTLGTAGNDSTVVGDYDGDGLDDPAVYDPSTGLWSWLGGTSHNSLQSESWMPNGIPAPGDYNGDGKYDFAVQLPPLSSPDAAKFRIAYNDGSVGPAADVAISYGLAIYAIVPGDYDGDGKCDIAQANLTGTSMVWRYLTSASNYTVQVKRTFGTSATDRTVQGDYDGDGKIDQAIYRRDTSPNDGVFIVFQSSTLTQTAPFDWGDADDYPVAYFNAH